MSKKGILDLFKTDKTVFTFKELALIWQENNKKNLASKIKYYLDKGDLISVRKGIYAKEGYDELELATKIYSPSYISFETVLRREGVIFQHYESVFVASYLSREIKYSDKKRIVFRKLKNEILFNSEGIIKKKNYFIASIASRERAFLDMIYLFGDYYFDNLKNMDWDKCRDLVKIYDNKQMIKRLDSYVKLEKA